MKKTDEDICPHCHRQYKTINTQHDSREVIFYYCEIEGEPERINYPRCGGDRRVCERGLFQEEKHC
ncbi:MAG: hypothetical protein JXA95_18500 [Spirochaetales bacterium]|nr:hypothetical protein [Spirochaetales bacterium]